MTKTTTVDCAQFVSTYELAESLKIRYVHLYSLIMRGHIPEPKRKFGRSWMWTPEEAAVAKKIVDDRTMKRFRAMQARCRKAKACETKKM